MEQPRKYLIVNADDFGLTEQINSGVIKGFLKGIITSASIMPTGKAFDHAVTLAKEYSDLGVGVHLALTQTFPTLPAKCIPTLVNQAGHFYDSWRSFFIRFIMGKIRLSEVEQEMEAQIKRVLASGISPTHLDAHQHIHILPGIWNIMSNLAYKYDIRFIRYPYESSVVGSVSIKHLVKLLCIQGMLNFVDRKKTWIGAKSPEYFLGLSASEKINGRILTRYLRSLKDGLTELMCHPRADIHGFDELDALTSPEIKQLINQLNIKLINRLAIDE